MAAHFLIRTPRQEASPAQAVAGASARQGQSMRCFPRRRTRRRAATRSRPRAERQLGAEIDVGNDATRAVGVHQNDRPVALAHLATTQVYLRKFDKATAMERVR